MHFRNYAVEKFNTYYRASGETHLAMLKNAPVKNFLGYYFPAKKRKLASKGLRPGKKVGQSQS